MTLKLIEAREMLDRFRFTVHLDMTRMDPNDPTKPDPAWLYKREWPLKQGGQRSAYLNSIRIELGDDARKELAKRLDEESGGIPLPVEGTEFPP